MPWIPHDLLGLLNCLPSKFIMLSVHIPIDVYGSSRFHYGTENMLPDKLAFPVRESEIIQWVESEYLVAGDSGFLQEFSLRSSDVVFPLLHCPGDVLPEGTTLRCRPEAKDFDIPHIAKYNDLNLPVSILSQDMTISPYVVNYVPKCFRGSWISYRMLYFYMELALLIISAISFLFYTVSSIYSHLHRDDTTSYGHSVDDVTVVIPVYNQEPGVFRESISSVKANNARFIVVGDRCVSPYKEITEEFGGTFMEGDVMPGKNGAMATGIRNVKTEFTLFLDSDSTLPPGGIQKLVDTFAPDVGGVGAVIKLKGDGGGISYGAEFVERVREVILRSMNHKGSVMLLDGCCSMYRTELVRRFVLSDEFLRGRFLGRPVFHAGDDRKLTGFVIRNRYRAIRNFSVKVETGAPGNMKEYLKQQVRWARSGWMSFFKEIRNGTTREGGTFYKINLFYMYVIPVLIFGITLARSYHIIYRLFAEQFSDFLTQFPYLLTDAIIPHGHAMISAATASAFALIRFISFCFTVVGPLVFASAVLETMTRERIKTFFFGLIALSVMFLATIYGLFTVWKQPHLSPDFNAPEERVNISSLPNAK